MSALGKEFFHLLHSPYGLRCILLLSIYHNNGYLVGVQSLISIKKPTGNWQLIKQRKQALIHKGNWNLIVVDNLMCAVLEIKSY